MSRMPSILGHCQQGELFGAKREWIKRRNQVAVGGLGFVDSVSGSRSQGTLGDTLAFSIPNGSCFLAQSYQRGHWATDSKRPKLQRKAQGADVAWSSQTDY